MAIRGNRSQVPAGALGFVVELEQAEAPQNPKIIKAAKSAEVMFFIGFPSELNHNKGPNLEAARGKTFRPKWKAIK